MKMVCSRNYNEINKGAIKRVLFVILFPCFLLGLQVTSAIGQETAPATGADIKEESKSSEKEAEPQEPDIIVESKKLLKEREELLTRVNDLRAKRRKATGEDWLVLDRQIMDTKLEYLRMFDDMVGKVLDLEAAEVDVSEINLRDVVEKDLAKLPETVVKNIRAAEQRLKILNNERDSVSVENLSDFEQKYGKAMHWLDTLYSAYYTIIEHREDLALDTKSQRKDLARRLTHRADFLSGRVRLVDEHLAQVNDRIQADPENPSLKSVLTALRDRKKILITSLSTMVRLMSELKLDVADYRKFLITTTGEVTTDIFRFRVLVGLLQEGMQKVWTWFQERGPVIFVKALIFILIVLGFKIIAVIVRRIMRRAFTGKLARASQLLQKMVIGTAGNAILVIGVLVALSQLGVELAPILTGLGIAGFIVGFALQDSLSNFAAGMMILGYRPYDVGDFIEAGGVSGKVHDMNLVSTTIFTFDNQTLIVPNAKIWGNVIRNVTLQKERRVDMKFRISFADNIEHAERVLKQILADHPRILAEPEPVVKVHELTENSVDFVVRPWVKTEDYWEVYWDVTREVKNRFDEEGITIPVPQRSVQLSKDIKKEVTD